MVQCSILLRVQRRGGGTGPSAAAVAVAKDHANFYFLLENKNRCGHTLSMDAETLRALIHYDPLTGVFTRRKAWGSKPTGSVIGGLNRHGYWQISVDKRTYTAQRLAWLYMTGSWPCSDVDHINRDRYDNRFENLREASRSENLQNARRRDNNTSGYTGVSWSKSKKRWRAEIMVDGKRMYLGRFKTKEEAATARQKATVQFHPFAVTRHL
jgi:hypothetical protein